MQTIVSGRVVELSDEQLSMFGVMTRLQQNMALRLLEGMEPSQAYVAAGGKARNPPTIASCASEIRNNPNVQGFLQSFNVHRAASAVMSREEMIERLSKMARTDIDDILTIHNKPVVDIENGFQVAQSAWALKPVEEMANGGICAISELTAGKDGLKVKLHDQKAAMKQLAELMGYNKPQQVEVTVKKSLSDFYDEANA